MDLLKLKLPMMKHILILLLLANTAIFGQSIEYGVTIITHGFDQSGGNIENTSWMYTLGKSIVDKYGGEVYFYQRNTGLFNLAYAPKSKSKGEIVLVFDWAEESNFDGRGFSEAAGDALFAALMRSPFRLLNLHFIGHSRGTVVNTECVLRLLSANIPVDHVTNIDPHDWGVGPIGTDHDNHPELPKIDFPGASIFSNHPGVVSWKGVGFSDTYYQNNGFETQNGRNGQVDCDTCIGGIEGREVTGTVNKLWNYYENKKLCHTNIHKCAYAETVLNPTSKNGGHFFSRLAGKNGRQPTGEYPIDKSFSFHERIKDRIKGIVNGDFERGGAISFKHLPGWGSRHGGGFTGEYKYLFGNNYMELEEKEYVRHNYFYIPKDAKGIKFKYANNAKSNSVLEVRINDGLSKMVFSQKLDSLTNGLVAKSFSVKQYAGKVVTIEFIVNGSYNAEVEIDDIEFGEINSTYTLFLFDLSGSMMETGPNASIPKLDQAKNASKQTLKALKNNNSGTEDEVAVLGFSGDCVADPTILISDFETNLQVVENRINTMMAGGGTPLAEAVRAAQCKLANHLAQTGQDRGKLILLSDGQATCQAIRPVGTYNSAPLGQKDILVSADQCGTGKQQIKYYTIGFNISPGSPAERDLQYLSQISGGKYLNVQSQTQLERAFRKFNRTYVPKPNPSLNGLPAPSLGKFDEGVNQITGESFPSALKTCGEFAALHPDDCHGAYNLALMQEANDFYKQAIANYKKYLSLCPNASDRDFVERQIAFLEEEFKQFVLFQKEVIKSDLEYLKLHFERIQNGQSVALAEEFKGFLKEKGNYYKDLPEQIGRADRVFPKNCQEVATGLANCAAAIKRNPQTWDRDATPTLSLTYINLERLLDSF